MLRFSLEVMKNELCRPALSNCAAYHWDCRRTPRPGDGLTLPADSSPIEKVFSPQWMSTELTPVLILDLRTAPGSRILASPRRKTSECTKCDLMSDPIVDRTHVAFVLPVGVIRKSVHGGFRWRLQRDCRIYPPAGDGRLISSCVRRET
jgi:hypothetical protein